MNPAMNDAMQDDLMALLGEIENLDGELDVTAELRAVEEEIEADAKPALGEGSLWVEELPEEIQVAKTEDLDAPVAEKPKKAAKPKAEKKAAAPKPAKEPKVKAEKAPKEPKPEKVKVEKAPRKVYDVKADRLPDTLGTQLGALSVLDVQDAAKSIDENRDATMAIIKAMPVKVMNRAINMMEFLGGLVALNTPSTIAMKVIARDQSIGVGKDSAYLKEMMTMGYSPKSAASMGRNTLNMLADLNMIQKDGANFVPVASSTLLAVALNKLSLAG